MMRFARVRVRRAHPRGLRGAVLALLILFTTAATSIGQETRAQERPNAAEARRAIGQLWSPYCPGMLENCTSPQGAALRDSIYDLAAQGMRADAIVEWAISRHGEELRAVPQRQGAGLWAWFIPPLALLAGLALIVLWLRSSRRDPPAAPAESSNISPAERDELASALREWQSSGEEEL